MSEPWCLGSPLPSNLEILSPRVTSCPLPAPGAHNHTRISLWLLTFFIFWLPDLGKENVCWVCWVCRVGSAHCCTVHYDPTLFWDIRNLFWYENISVSKANIQRNTESRWAREDSLIFGSSLFSTPRTTTSQWTCSSILSASGTSVSVHVHSHDLW